MISIKDYIINKESINYIRLSKTEQDGYTWKETYHLYIHFDKDDIIHLKTYDENEYNKWLDLLKEVLL